MTHLTADETRVLRITLGLHDTQRSGITQNYLPPTYAEQYAEAVASLVARGYLYQREEPFKATYRTIPAGTHAATPAGRVAVQDMPWK